MVDIYHLTSDQMVLFCEARTVFTEAARLRLIATGTGTLYVRVTQHGIDAGGSDLATVLGLPDSVLAPAVKSAILYKSAVDTTQAIYDSPTRPKNLAVAQHIVGMVALRLSSSPDAFISLVEMMDHDTHLYSHAVNVCTYTVALGERMNLVKPVVIALGTSALVHDVGMSRVDRSVLNKPGPLTQAEFAIIRDHPEWGLEQLGALGTQHELIASVVRDHHERLDGSGYPRGLRGNRIDLLARMVAIADVYEALTSNRPYRRGLTPYEALEIIRRMLSQFDPDVFAQFVLLLGDVKP